MTWWMIIRNSLRQHALSTAITALSIGLGGGLLMAIWVVNFQSQRAFKNVTGGFDAIVCFWNCVTFTIVRRIRRHEQPITAVALSSDASVVASGDESGLVLLTKHDGSVLRRLAAHREQWVLEKLNHKWLGFERDNLLSIMQETGLTELQSELLPLRREELFQVILASGIKA